MKNKINKKSSIPVRFTQIIVRLYCTLLSPVLGRNCRFHPTCSSYMHDALEQHGFLKGMYLGARRILSCNPWNKKDFHDPVPKRFAWRDILGYKRSINLKNKQNHTEKNI